MKNNYVFPDKKKTIDTNPRLGPSHLVVSRPGIPQRSETTKPRVYVNNTHPTMINSLIIIYTI